MSRIDTATLLTRHSAASGGAFRFRKIVLGLLLLVLLLASLLILLRAQSFRQGGPLGDLLPGLGVLGQTVPPEISKEGWPHLEILQPRDGDVLSGTVLLRWRGEAPAGFGGIEVRIDRRRVFHFLEPTWEKTFDTSFLPEGEHTLEIRLMDVDRRQGIETVKVRVRRPQFALLRVAQRDPGAVVNGQEVVVEVATNGQEFDPKADFSALDSNFDGSRVHWQKSSTQEGALEVRYRISELNQRPDGSYWVTISLADQLAPQVEQSKKLLVTLSHPTPPISRSARPVNIPCAVFRHEALPPASGRESPFEVRGPSSVRVGEQVSLQLVWKEESQDIERRFLRVSVDGMRGYFALLGSCGADDRITIQAEHLTSQTLRLAIWPDEGLPAVHGLRVNP